MKKIEKLSGQYWSDKFYLKGEGNGASALQILMMKINELVDVVNDLKESEK